MADENEYRLKELNPIGPTTSKAGITQTDLNANLNNNNYDNDTQRDGDSKNQNSDRLTTRANLEPSATVKFTLLPMKQVVTFALSIRMLIKDMREQFSAELKANPNYVRFFTENDGKILKIFHLKKI